MLIIFPHRFQMQRLGYGFLQWILLSLGDLLVFGENRPVSRIGYKVVFLLLSGKFPVVRVIFDFKC